MVDLYGIMYGAKCAALGFITNNSISSSTNVCAYIKSSSDSEYTEVQGVLNQNFKYFFSAWEFDIMDLELNTTYDVYISISNDESNHLSFKTLSTTGTFNHSSVYWNYKTSTEITNPTETLLNTGTSVMNTFVNTLENIGYSNSDLTKYYLVDGTGFYYGGLTDGDKQYINIVSNNLNDILGVMVHEYRHRIFFGKFVTSGWGVGYASSKFSGNLLDNFYKVTSFFSRNNDKSELYFYYGENNGPDTHMLWGYFIIKILGKQTVNIVYK